MSRRSTAGTIGRRQRGASAATVAGSACAALLRSEHSGQAQPDAEPDALRRRARSRTFPAAARHSFRRAHERLTLRVRVESAGKLAVRNVLRQLLQRLLVLFFDADVEVS